MEGMSPPGSDGDGLPGRVDDSELLASPHKRHGGLDKEAAIGLLEDRHPDYSRGDRWGGCSGQVGGH